MKQAKILYFIVLFIVFAAFCLFEYELLPTHQIASSPATTYFLELLSAATSIGGTFLLLYAFRFKVIAHRVETKGEAFTVKVLKGILVLWLVLMLTNVIIYYQAPFATNARYSILILLAAIAFCWPQPIPTNKP